MLTRYQQRGQKAKKKPRSGYRFFLTTEYALPAPHRFRIAHPDTRQPMSRLDPSLREVTWYTPPASSNLKGLAMGYSVAGVEKGIHN
jgi:hypothetical protein